jgi:hypothetical protein
LVAGVVGGSAQGGGGILLILGHEQARGKGGEGKGKCLSAGTTGNLKRTRIL